MRTYRCLALAAVVFAACGLNHEPGVRLQVISSKTHSNIPSASGITARGKLFFVNADNGSFLYAIDSNGALIDSIGLLNHQRAAHTIAKPVKHDFEAATGIPFGDENPVLLLGSGTISPTRDSALLIDPQRPDRQRMASLRPFYNLLIRAGIPAKSINIEAAALAGDDLLLFNRGTNSMIRVPAKAFVNSIFMEDALPEPLVASIVLPKVNGRNPGISGATMLDAKTVLFCGSVEATDDWTKDGEVLGSGIGLIDISDSRHPKLRSWIMATDREGAILREKLEGIELLSKTGKTIRLRCVADNDNDTSTLIDLEMTVQ